MMQKAIWFDKSSAYAGGPGGTRTPNQAVMSGDNSRYLFVLYRVCLRLKPINPRFVPLFQGQTGATHDLRAAAAALKETGDEQASI